MDFWKGGCGPAARCQSRCHVPGPTSGALLGADQRRFRNNHDVRNPIFNKDRLGSVTHATQPHLSGKTCSKETLLLLAAPFPAYLLLRCFGCCNFVVATLQWCGRRHWWREHGQQQVLLALQRCLLSSQVLVPPACERRHLNSSRYVGGCHCPRSILGRAHSSAATGM